MGKLGKKKLAELAENEEKQKNGAAKASTDDENGYNKDSDEKNETGSSVSQTSSQKRGGGAKKRKSPAASTKLSTPGDSDSNNDDDSDDLPLNGSKTASVGVPPPKKARKAVNNKSAKTSANNGNKKSKSVELDESKDDDEDDEVKEYEVEAIVGQKTLHGASYFCVRWKGYGKEDDTWELESGLNCNALIEEYRKKANNNAHGKSKQKGKKSGAGKSTGTGSSGRGRPAAGGKTKANADPNKEWAVERIIQYVEDDEHGGLYRIRWKGFSAKDDTWEPESNLSCHNLIEKFKRGMEQQRNVDTKQLRESPKKTKRLVNETLPRTNINNRIGRSSKRAATKNRVFYGEE